MSKFVFQFGGLVCSRKAGFLYLLLRTSVESVQIIQSSKFSRVAVDASGTVATISDANTISREDSEGKWPAHKSYSSQMAVGPEGTVTTALEKRESPGAGLRHRPLRKFTEPQSKTLHRYLQRNRHGHRHRHKQRLAHGSIASKSLAFIDWGPEASAEWKVAASKSAMLFIPDVTVYVIADDVDGARQGMQSECPSVKEDRYHVIDLESVKGKDRREIDFAKHYRQSSANDKTYELNCFLRFFWLRTFMESRGIDHVLLADHDIMFFNDIFARYGLTDAVPFWSPFVQSSFFSYWSFHVLSKFCSYITKFYRRPKHAIFADIQKYGSSHPTPGVQPWMSPAWGKPKQFSDMYMVSAFVHTNRELRTYLEDPKKAWSLSEAKDWYDLGVQRHLFSTTGDCYTHNNTEDQRFQWREVAAESNFSRFLMPVVDGVQVPAMHFQGPCKSSMIGVANRVGITCPGTAAALEHVADAEDVSMEKRPKGSEELQA